MLRSSLSGFLDFFWRVWAGDLVHETAKEDPLVEFRHSSFITSHLAGGLLVLAGLVLYLLLGGQLSLLSACIFLWLSMPAVIAVFVMRTGRLALGHLMSSLNLAGLVTAGICLTGGITSFLTPWMVLVPVEGGLSGDRRVVRLTIAVALCCLIGVALISMTGGLPSDVLQADHVYVLGVAGTFLAVLYGGMIALNVERHHELSKENLRQSEERYRLLGENASDMITLHDRRGGVIYASPAAREIMRQDAELLLGERFLDCIDHRDRGKVENALRVAAKEKITVSARFRVAVANRTEGGSIGERWAEMRCQPVLGGEDVPRQHHYDVVAVTRDISEQYEQEAALVAARERAESADRMKARFLANAGHELKTPLNAVIGFSRMLVRELKDAPGSEVQRDHALQILDGGEQLSALVDNILDIARIEGGTYEVQKEAICVNELVDGVVQISNEDFRAKGVDLKTKVAHGLAPLMADERVCRQMLSILMRNALRYSRAGGSVLLRAARHGVNITIEVIDDGDGLEADKLPLLGQLCGPATLSNSGAVDLGGLDALGLGLAKVRGIMALHGGWMEIASDFGRGTRVTLWFPSGEAINQIEVASPLVSSSPAVRRRGRSAA